MEFTSGTRSGRVFSAVYDDGGFPDPVFSGEEKIKDWPGLEAWPDVVTEQPPVSNRIFPRDRRFERMYKRTRNVYAPVASTALVNQAVANRVISLSGREFVADVSATHTANVTSPFNCQSKLLRPTDGDLFSWLAAIAKKFEEFKFHSIRFIYEPQVSSSTTGQVGLFFDGDPTHLPPGNWNGFVNTGATSHGAVWAKHVLQVPAHLFASRKSYYTVAEFPDANSASTLQTQLNSGLVPNKPTDPLEYYPGLFGFVSEGVSSVIGSGETLVIGKVYIEYSLSLRTQNVDGYNITTTSGQIANTETAVNSGIGYFFKLSTYPGANLYPWGTYPAATPYTVAQNAGSCPFKAVQINGVVYQQAISQLNILVIGRCTSATNNTLSLEGAPPTAAFVDPTFTTIASSSLPNATVVSAFCQVIKDMTPSGTDMCFAWQVALPPGYYLRIKSAITPTYFHVCITPWAFAIQNS